MGNNTWATIPSIFLYTLVWICICVKCFPFLISTSTDFSLLISLSFSFTVLIQYIESYCTRKCSHTHCSSNTKVKERNSHPNITYIVRVLIFFSLSFYFSSNSQHHRESLVKKSVALMTCYSPLAWVYNGELRADLPSQLGVGGKN